MWAYNLNRKLAGILLYPALGFVFWLEIGPPVAAESEDSKPLRVGYQSSPPYQVVNDDGTLEGIGIDLVRTAAQRLNIELQWVYSPKAPDFHLVDDDIDIWPVVTDLPHRRQNFHITKPIYENSLGVLSRLDSPIDSPKAAAGKRIAYYDREPSLTLVPQLLPGAHRVGLPDHSAAIESVLQGRSDGAFLWSTKANSLTFKSALERYPGVPIYFYTFPDAKLSCGIGARRDNPAAVAAADAIREEIRQLVREGYVQTVYFRYYLDPENEISSYFWLDDLRSKASALWLAILGLLVLVAGLVVMAISLRRSRERAFAASRAKSEFLANMSHEFRTPLNGILGMAQLARMNPADEEQGELLEVVISSGETMLALVNDVLDLSKMESGKLSVESEPLKIEELLKTSTSHYELAARRKSLGFEIYVDSRCPATIKGDIARLRQILFHLIGNAVKFTDKGKVRVSLNVLRTKSEEHLVIDVSDTGIGIQDSLRSEIFDAFNQADTSVTRTYGGAGVGLTIAMRLIQLLGGKIFVESVVGRGSVFSVLIPLVRVNQEEGAEVEDQPRNVAAHRDSFDILVVDDNPLNLTTMAAVLRRMDHDVTCVKSGAEALEAIGKSSFDLVFLDLQMPDMDGWETARAIRQKQSGQPRRTPIIALSSNASSQSLRNRVEQEMDGLIYKPAEISALDRELRRMSSQIALKSVGNG